MKIARSGSTLPPGSTTSRGSTGRRRVGPAITIAGAVLALAVGACTGAATPAPSLVPVPTAAATATPPQPTAVPTPSFAPVPTPVPTPMPSLVIPPTTAAEAAAIVIAANPRFEGIRPLDPNLIGASSWYEAKQDGGGWVVTFTQGWGDCQAGCISRHTWTFAVDATGSARLVSEGGDPAEGIPSPGSGTGGGTTGTGGTGGSPAIQVPTDPGPWLIGFAGAGPVCPVVRNPPDPACADRPVAGAVVVVTTAAGAEVARGTTDAKGVYVIHLPDGGDYLVAAQPVEGLLGTPAPQPVSVPAGSGGSARIDLAYDTGIR